MQSSLEFYFGRLLLKLDRVRTIRWKLFGQGETLSASQLYDRFVQDLFSYGMQVCKDREVVMEALLRLFTQIHDRGERQGADRRVRLSLYKRFRKVLTQLIIASDKKKPFESRISEEIQNHTSLQREAIFLILNCEFNNREVAAIMDVKLSTLSNLVDQAVGNLRQMRKNQK